MKTKILFQVIFLTSFLLTNLIYSQTEPKKHSFVGAESCGMCHKTEKQGKQLDIWKNSKHALAYETLKSEKANQIAKEKGFDKPAVEVEDCLKCHASGYNVDATLIGKKFNVADGVQCETCHGPGSDYQKLTIMKDKAKAIENGLIFYEKPEELCVTCHNSESPTFTEFKFEEMWSKIKHEVPKN